MHIVQEGAIVTPFHEGMGIYSQEQGGKILARAFFYLGELKAASTEQGFNYHELNDSIICELNKKPNPKELIVITGKKDKDCATGLVVNKGQTRDAIRAIKQKNQQRILKKRF